MDNIRRIIETDYTRCIPSQCKGRGSGYHLSEAQIEYIRQMYPTTNTNHLADELGINKATVRRHAKRMGLSKDAGYMHLMNQEKGRMRRAAQIEIQKTCPRKWVSQFQKGHSAREHMTEEQILAYNRKISESKKAVYRRERRRVEFGLPQQTHIKVGRQPPKKLRLKYRLKAKGYVIDGGIAYYDENTTRAMTCEKKGNPWFEFRPKGGHDD